MPYETRTGKSEHGVCQQCGADRVLNPKTGKIFCSERCWLNGQPQQPYNAPQAPRTSEPTQNIELSQFLTKTEYNENLDRQRQAFKEMAGRIAELTRQLDYFKELWATQNPNANEFHKDQIPIIGAENFVEDATKALGL